MKWFLLLTCLGLFSNSSLFSQALQPNDPIPQQKAWSKIFYKEIDLRQKFNHIWYFKGLEDKSFTEVLISLAENQQIPAYSVGILGDQEDFSTPLTQLEIKRILYDTSYFMVDNLEGEEIMHSAIEKTDPKNVWYLEVKEEWYYDRIEGRMKCAIQAICPKLVIFDPDGKIKGVKKLFWIDLAQARGEVSKYHPSSKNLEEGVSFIDLLDMHYYQARVIEVSNMYNRSIAEYKEGTDALLEGEKKQKELFDLEQDLWIY